MEPASPGVTVVPLITLSGVATRLYVDVKVKGPKADACGATACRCLSTGPAVTNPKTTGRALLDLMISVDIWVLFKGTLYVGGEAKGKDQPADQKE